MRYALIVACIVLAASQRAQAQQERHSSHTSTSEVFAIELRREREKELSRYIDSLILTERQQRALELQVANQNPVTTLICELSKYTPYRFKPEVDTFFLQNYMRRDFNPVDEDKLLLGLRRSAPRFSVRLGQ